MRYFRGDLWGIFEDLFRDYLLEVLHSLASMSVLNEKGRAQKEPVYSYSNLICQVLVLPVTCIRMR